MNLFEIDSEYRDILHMLEETEGEITPEIEQALNNNEGDFLKKVTNYRNMIFKWKSDLQVIKDKRARLSAIENNRNNSIERLKNALEYVMANRSLRSVDLGVNGSIGYRKSTVTIVDEDALDPKWIKTTYVGKPMRAEIKKALKDGETVEGAWLEERDNLQIK
jgi:NurA-like 5'-3' nuclease